MRTFILLITINQGTIIKASLLTTVHILCVAMGLTYGEIRTSESPINELPNGRLTHQNLNPFPASPPLPRAFDNQQQTTQNLNELITNVIPAEKKSRKSFPIAFKATNRHKYKRLSERKKDAV